MMLRLILQGWQVLQEQSDGWMLRLRRTTGTAAQHDR